MFEGEMVDYNLIQKIPHQITPKKTAAYTL